MPPQNGMEFLRPVELRDVKERLVFRVRKRRFAKGPGHDRAHPRACPSRNPNSAKDCPTSFTVKLGSWFEARATGWGEAAIPVLLLFAATAAAAHLMLR